MKVRWQEVGRGRKRQEEAGRGALRPKQEM